MASERLNFMGLMQSFRRGTLLNEADSQLQELIQAVKDTGGKGERRVPDHRNGAAHKPPRSWCPGCGRVGRTPG